MSSAIELLRGKRVIVMLGSGGVGKTTSSIALAMLGAEEGRRVALLSIDPAKRLASALGLRLGDKLSAVKLPASCKGSLDAAMLDQKAVFDEMVRRHAPSEKVSKAILSHPVYQAASTNLIGPLEYMALAKLQELSEDSRYDLIVLDTPPDAHALDFLARPNILSGFMENRVMTWLVKPFLLARRIGIGRLFSAGEKLMGGIAKVTGAKALHAFGDFLVLMQEVIGGFHRSGERVVGLLKEPTTSFIACSVPSLASMRSASQLVEELAKLDYRCSALICNRGLPAAVRHELSEIGAGGHGDLGSLERRWLSEQESVRAFVAALRGERTPAKRGIDVVWVPEQRHELDGAEAILAMAHSFRLDERP